MQAFATPSNALVWVVATPGKGKSVVSVDAASAHLQDGGFALWLSEQDVKDAESPWEAVNSAIRRDCRTLEAEAGKQTLRLATISRRLVLLIDDLHRLQNPEDAFRKVRNWVRCASTPADNEKAKGGAGSSCVFVCPIWPQHLDKLDESRAVPSERPSWEAIFEVPKFSESETASIFSGTDLSALEVQAIADELDFDPLLCALAAERIRRERTAKPDATRRIIRWYLEQQLKRVVDRTGRPASEYLDAVQHLAEAMLRAKNLRPKWSCVQAWIGNAETLARLTELFKERAAIYCEAGSETVLFNHDRFLDAMCAGAIANLINDSEVCRDPYFAEIIGRAIAEDKLTDAGISQILCINPLAVFCGLMFATSEAVKQKLSPLLIRWAQEHGRDKNLPSRLLFEIALKLLMTDSPSVVEFPGRLPEVWGLDLAALRNGSANYGANYCRTYEGFTFMPSVRDPRRDAIMDHARANHATKLVTDLNRDLKQPGLPVEYQNACLILAGFLRLEGLTVGIELCWKNCPPNQRPEIIASAVWAITQCAHQRFAELLLPVFEVWQTIPDQGASESDHPRSNIAFYSLGHCQPQWMSETVVQWLISVLPSYLNSEYFLPQWLDRCTPYLQHASQETLRRLKLLRHSPLSWKWYEQHVVPLLRPESHTELDERMEPENLERNFRRNPDLYYGAHRLFEHLEQTGLDKKKILRRVAGEARLTPTAENLNWLAACVGVVGNREDISLLNGEFTGMPSHLLTKLRTDCAFSVMRRSL